MREFIQSLDAELVMGWAVLVATLALLVVLIVIILRTARPRHRYRRHRWVRR